jgi:iron complex outermembrane receptor protein
MGQIGPDNIRVNGANVLGRWLRTLSPGADFKLQAYLDRTHRRIPGSFTQDLNTADLDFQHRFPLAAIHDIVWGFGYRIAEDRVVNTRENAFLPPQVSREWFNVFFQDEIALNKDRVALTIGSKVEHNDYTGYEFEPSARLAFTPDKHHTLWGALSRAVRTPSRIDRDLFSPAAPPYRIAGGKHVVSEKLIAYEMGYRIQLGPQFALSAAAFLNDYDDLRSIEPLNPPFAFPVQASSELRGRSVGAELTAEWRAAPPWRLRAGYTEMRVRSEPQPGTDARATRDSIARDPNHQFRIRSLWDLSSRWEIDLDLRYTSPITTQRAPGYTESNLRVGWTPSAEWELSLLGQNLLHNHHPEFNAPGSRREIQRGVYAKASWRF